MSPKQIEAALLKYSGEKGQGKKEDRQEFLQRIAVAVNSKDDDKGFSKLPKEAVSWFEDCVKASKAKADTLPDFAEVEEEAPKGKGLVLASKGKSTGKASKGNGEDKPSKKKVEKPKKPEAKAGYRSMADALRHVMCSRPKNIPSFDDVKKELKARKLMGDNEAHIMHQYGMVKGTIEMLQHLGKL